MWSLAFRLKNYFPEEPGVTIVPVRKPWGFWLSTQQCTMASETALLDQGHLWEREQEREHIKEGVVSLHTLLVRPGLRSTVHSHWEHIWRGTDLRMFLPAAPYGRWNTCVQIADGLSHYIDSAEPQCPELEVTGRRQCNTFQFHIRNNFLQLGWLKHWTGWNQEGPRRLLGYGNFQSLPGW